MTYAAVLKNYPYYVIGVINDPNFNPYVDTDVIEIPQLYLVQAGYTWDGSYFITQFGQVVGVDPTDNCAVCLKSTGEVVNIIVAKSTDPWPDQDQELITIPFNVLVYIGCYWDGSKFVESGA